jgi:cytidylate kinase
VHVRLMAPAAMRSQTIAAQQNISMAAAQAQIETSDRYRQTYLERFYNVAWDDPCLYDLILNVGNLSVDQTTDIILHAYKILSNRAGVPGEAF